MPILDHLEPQAVFSYFEQLCAIPHGSGNTKAISDFLVRFAAAHHLRCIQDAHNNVVIFSPGTPGYEAAAPVILQGHMDMVCETAPDCTKDMTREGLDLFVDGDTIGARGTTLGGDDGIAVAMALAILDADDIPHPPLEIVITVDEETGMLGAAAPSMPVSSSTVMTISSGGWGMSSASRIASAMATAMPSSPPSVVPRAPIVSPSTKRSSPSRVMSFVQSGAVSQTMSICPCRMTGAAASYPGVPGEKMTTLLCAS